MSTAIILDPSYDYDDDDVAERKAYNKNRSMSKTLLILLYEMSITQMMLLGGRRVTAATRIIILQVICYGILKWYDDLCIFIVHYE